MTARDRDARVQAMDEAATLMLAGRYIPGSTDVALAAKWGLTAAQVSEVRREAARHCAVLVRRHPEEREALLDHHWADHRRLYVAALEVGDLRTAAAVLKQMTDLAGLAAPTRTEVTVQTPSEKLAGMDPPARLRALYEARTALEQAIADEERAQGVVSVGRRLG